MKNIIKLTGLPRICFAHTFSAENYHCVIDAHEKGEASLEVAYITDGELECSFGESKPVIARKNSVVCNLRLNDLKIDTHNPHTHHTVCFWLPYQLTDELDEASFCLPNVINFEEGNSAIRLIDEIIANHTVRSKGPLAATGLFLQLLDTLDRSTRITDTEIPYSNIRYIKKAKKYIFSHINEPILQSEIAEYLGISPEYLCAVFKKTEGVPIMQFINRIKLEQIRLTVEKNGLSLAEASERYGYSDPNYVSRLHKKYFNHNITDIKKQKE